MEHGKGAQMGSQVRLLEVLTRLIFLMSVLSDNLTDPQTFIHRKKPYRYVHAMCGYRDIYMLGVRKIEVQVLGTSPPVYRVRAAEFHPPLRQISRSLRMYEVQRGARYYLTRYDFCELRFYFILISAWLFIDACPSRGDYEIPTLPVGIWA